MSSFFSFFIGEVIKVLQIHIPTVLHFHKIKVKILESDQLLVSPYNIRIEAKTYVVLKCLTKFVTLIVFKSKISFQKID